MHRLRVLITNTRLSAHTGTELYVRELAHGLVAAGHTPLVYSPELGPVAHGLRAAGIDVVNSPEKLSTAPDVIHGHHEIAAMRAFLACPGVPGIFVIHDRLHHSDIAPRFPRILRYVAVDHNCRERLVEEAIPNQRIQVVLNWVDLARFRPRGPLPPRPRRALLFSNYASERTHLGVVREACARLGLPLDVVGTASGRPCEQPEAILAQYDLVFAKARCALEALAVGAAVVLCDARGIGSLVTSAELDRLRLLNLGMQTLTEPVQPEILLRQIARYDAEDAAEVSRRIRATAGLDAAIDQLLATYRDVIAEHARAPADPETEARAAAAYLRASLERRVRDRLKRIPALGPLLVALNWKVAGHPASRLGSADRGR